MEVKEIKRVVYADPARMKLAEYERQDWVLNVPEEVVPTDLVKPDFWAHMASQMKPYDRVEVRQEDGTWVADLIVLLTDRTWAKVHVLNLYEIPLEAAVKGEEKHEVAFKGPQRKWCVIRKADGEILKDGMGKVEATQWKDEHERIVG